MTDNIRDLTGKVAIVTGAGNPGNLGAVTAQALAEAGASVVLADIPGTKMPEIVASLTEMGLQAAACEVDISQEASVVKLYEFTLQMYKKLDILVNNAGVVGDRRDRDVMSMEVEVWDRAMAVNLRGTMLMCKHALPIMIANGGGSIINISSAASLAGDFSPTAYGCTKAAINNLTRYVATQCGRQGVRCNALAPGLVMTPSISAGMPAPMKDIFLANELTDRLGRPEDIAEAVHFLASDRSAWITGQVFSIDGGFFAHFPTMTGMMAMMGKR